MKITKHFALAALLVLGAMLAASTPASAQSGESSSSSGSLYNVGDEPRAKGGFTDSWGWYSPEPWWWDTFTVTSWMEVSVRCTKLTPGATYVFYVATWDVVRGEKSMSLSVVAKRSGKAEVAVGDSITLNNTSLLIYLRSIEVYRVDGSDLVPVLALTPP
jgi:hypothetical protein